MPITIAIDEISPKVRFNGQTALGASADVNGAVFTVDDPLCTFQATGDGKSAIVHPTTPGSTTIRATAVNVLGQAITATPEQLSITGPVAVGGTITKV